MAEKASTRIARHYRKIKQERSVHRPVNAYFDHPGTGERLVNSISIPVPLLEELLKEKHI